MDIKDLHNKILSLEEKIKARDFIQSDPNIDISSSDIRLDFNSKESIKSAKKEAIERIKANGDQIIKMPEGDIYFESSGAKTSLSHTINQEKIDSLPYISEGIKKGMIVDISDDIDKKPIKNMLSVLPVRIEKLKKLLVIRLRQNKGQNIKFYNHNIYDIDELKEKSDPGKLPVANPGYNPDSQEASHRGIAYTKNILHNILNVKDKEC